MRPGAVRSGCWGAGGGRVTDRRQKGLRRQEGPDGLRLSGAKTGCLNFKTFIDLSSHFFLCLQVLLLLLLYHVSYPPQTQFKPSPHAVRTGGEEERRPAQRVWDELGVRAGSGLRRWQARLRGRGGRGGMWWGSQKRVPGRVSHKGCCPPPLARSHACPQQTGWCRRSGSSGTQVPEERT